jgi:hypothetical protein
MQFGLPLVFGVVAGIAMYADAMFRGTTSWKAWISFVLH